METPPGFFAQVHIERIHCALESEIYTALRWFNWTFLCRPLPTLSFLKINYVNGCFQFYTIWLCVCKSTERLSQADVALAKTNSDINSQRSFARVLSLLLIRKGAVFHARNKGFVTEITAGTPAIPTPGVRVEAKPLHRALQGHDPRTCALLGCQPAMRYDTGERCHGPRLHVSMCSHAPFPRGMGV